MKLTLVVVWSLVAACSGSQGEPGAQGAMGEPGAAGAMGSAGPAGMDGTLRVYGDGSALSHVVSTDENWVTTPPDNLQFADFTIDAGKTLTVPSGTIIRVTGTFTNNGTISVVEGTARDDGEPNIPLESGVAMTPASHGQYGPASFYVAGGRGGRGIKELQARLVLVPGHKGGGAGGSSYSPGGGGGGAFTVIARGAIVNHAGAAIDADGVSAPLGGGGGGGGGVVVLASRTSVTNDGTINARGGNGSDNDVGTGGSGGGGGGGIIHLLAPVVVAGTRNVGGGVPGSSATVATDPRHGGGGGGGCGGSGGGGSTVEISNAAPGGAPGTGGYALTTTADPSALF